jgi:hypothetical protein
MVLEDLRAIASQRNVEPGQNTKVCARSAAALSLFFPCWRAASRPRAEARVHVRLDVR